MEAQMEFKMIYDFCGKDFTTYFDNLESIKEFAGYLDEECVTYYAYQRINNRWRLIVA